MPRLGPPDGVAPSLLQPAVRRFGGAQHRRGRLQPKLRRACRSRGRGQPGRSPCFLIAGLGRGSLRRRGGLIDRGKRGSGSSSSTRFSEAPSAPLDPRPPSTTSSGCDERPPAGCVKRRATPDRTGLVQSGGTGSLGQGKDDRRAQRGHQGGQAHRVRAGSRRLVRPSRLFGSGYVITATCPRGVTSGGRAGAGAPQATEA
jgi:hypothetical protein